MKISTRLNGRVTSVNIKNSVCALHYMICGEDTVEANLEHHVLDTCHNIINTWEGDTGKGLSGYITDKMLEDLLDANDLLVYKRLLTTLERS